MLWHCEEYPPDHEFWDDSSSGIINAVQNLFKKLLLAMEKEFLPYYFIPEINVFENIPKALLQQAKLEVEKIVKKHYVTFTRKY